MKISLTENNYVVFDKSESLLTCVLRNLLTAVMLGFCVYISQGSTWWTFVSGLMFISWLFCTLFAIANQRTRNFSSWAEFKAWIDERVKEEAQP